MKRLIVAGADVNAARWDGTTALMIAANSGAAEAVKLLLERGAKVNAAESQKRPDGADVGRIGRPFGGRAGIDQAWRGREGRLKNRIRRVGLRRRQERRAVSVTIDRRRRRPNTKLPDGSSVLIAAAAFRGTEAAIALVEGGAEVKVADQRGNTPLHTAAQLGDLELVKELLAKGADPNARNAKALMRGGPAAGPFRPPAGEITPLHVATRAGQLEIVKKLSLPSAQIRN